MEKISCWNVLQKAIANEWNTRRKSGFDCVYPSEWHVKEAGMARTPGRGCQSEHRCEMCTVQSMVKYGVHEQSIGLDEPRLDRRHVKEREKTLVFQGWKPHLSI